MYQSIRKIDEDAVQVLNDGRIFVDYGPVSMVIMASADNQILSELSIESTQLIPGYLKEIKNAYDLLSRYPDQLCLNDFTGIPQEMVKAVKRIEDQTLTPMAAVAGSLSDALADWLYDRGADKVIVNNGGDIAIRLSADQSIMMGILPDIKSGQLSNKIIIRAEDGIGGVCTSGLGGRSLTCGIARSVTVLSTRCGVADACATHLANASYIESKAVLTVPAGLIRPETDIPELNVVTRVGHLTYKEVCQSLDQIKRETQHQYQMKNLFSVFADVGGYSFQWREEEA